MLPEFFWFGYNYDKMVLSAYCDQRSVFSKDLHVFITQKTPEDDEKTTAEFTFSSFAEAQELQKLVNDMMSYLGEALEQDSLNG